MVQTRNILLGIVSALPGIRFLELKKRTGLANGVLAYHLSVLEKESLLKADRGPGYVEFYPANFAQADVPLFGMVRHDRSRKIIQSLLQSRELSHGEIASSLGASPSTASWYLGRMLKEGVVNATYSGRETRYKLVDPQRASRLLSIYKSTWQDAMVDRFASIWDEHRINFGK